MADISKKLAKKLNERLNWNTFKTEIKQGLDWLPQSGMVLPEALLVQRLLQADKGATIGLKTLKNFITKKLSDSPYWKNIDLVNPDDLKKFRVVNRYYDPKYTGHVEGVEKYLTENGIDDAGILFVDPKSHQAMLNEGNTRLSIALRNEAPFYPVRGYRWSSVEPNFPTVSKHPIPNDFGYTPADLFMKDLGFETYNPQELLKNTIIKRLMEIL